MTDQIPTPPDDDPKWAITDALQENLKWADEAALKGQKANNELWALKAVGFGTFFLILTFIGIFIVSLIAWVWHYVTPEYWAWLSDNQLSKIQSVIFSGAIASVATSYASKYLNRNE